LIKISDITSKFKNLFSLKVEIENELNKCDVLCANCHFYLHSNHLYYESNKDEVMRNLSKFRVINSKLDEKKIIEMYKSGFRQIEISKFFNVNKSTISTIIKRLKGKNEI
jgi:DNA-binding MarR family transcriptional regulator